MKDFHCGTLELSFVIGGGDIDKNTFLAETGSEGQDDLDSYLVFDSKEHPGEQHAHIGIQTRPEDKIEVRISYHDSVGKTEGEDAKPPYMEECAKWLGKLIKPNKVKATIVVTYFFDKTYTPRVKLPYALKISEKGLEGGLITGVSIQFPAESQLDYALIQRSREINLLDFGVSISTHTEIQIKRFDLYEELKRLEPSVMLLLRKRTQQNEKRQKKQH